MSVYTSNDDELCCPLCGETNVHVGSFPADLAEPTGVKVGAGLGIRTALFGWCEYCEAQFAVLFTDYHGVTYVESIHLGELDTGAAGAA